MDEKEIRLELAFNKQGFSGIVVNNYLIEEGEVIVYIRKLLSRVKELEYERRGR